MKNVERFRSEEDRYFFDREDCSSDEGFVQIDTRQDSWYFGMWTNPYTFTTVSYCEGDVCITTFDNVDEYVSYIRESDAYFVEAGYGHIGIDPGWPGEPGTDEAIRRFRELGLEDLLH